MMMFCDAQRTGDGGDTTTTVRHRELVTSLDKIQAAVCCIRDDGRTNCHSSSWEQKDTMLHVGGNVAVLDKADEFCTCGAGRNYEKTNPTAGTTVTVLSAAPTAAAPDMVTLFLDKDGDYEYDVSMEISTATNGQESLPIHSCSSDCSNSDNANPCVASTTSYIIFRVKNAEEDAGSSSPTTSDTNSNLRGSSPDSPKNDSGDDGRVVGAAGGNTLVVRDDVSLQKSGGIIFGATIGGVVVLVSLGFMYLYCTKRGKEHQNGHDDVWRNKDYVHGGTTEGGAAGAAATKKKRKSIAAEQHDDEDPTEMFSGAFDDLD